MTDTSERPAPEAAEHEHSNQPAVTPVETAVEPAAPEPAAAEAAVAPELPLPELPLAEAPMMALPTADMPAPAETAPAEPAAATDVSPEPEAPEAPMALESEAVPVEAATAEEPTGSEDEDEEDVAEEDTTPRVTFADLGLSEPIVRAVAEAGYVTPTPIQEAAIPIVLMGRDVLGCAQTGTGKTAGFTLPMLDILASGRAKARMPRSLILEPTRELALQVAENFVKYGKHLNLVHALLIGGESMNDQRNVLDKGVDVLIATPGRLLDLFDRGRILLADCKVLVIDEADRMLDMGFIPDVERIVSMLPAMRQTLFFSATMAPEIRKLADAFLQNPKEISVSAPASVASTITAGLLWTRELDKREALRRLIRREEVQTALIFCNRKVEVDILYKSLKRHGFSVGSLHGDMSQPERFATLAKFKANEIRLLVCSDVAARGLDIGGLSHVFNFDVPIHAEDYVHRIGRTGRAGLTGHAFTLATPDDRQFVDAIEKLIGAPIPRMQVEGMEEVAFAEDDGKRRRGRSRGTGAKAAPRAAKAPKPAADAAEETAPKAAKPRRSRAKKAAPSVTEQEALPAAAIAEEPALPEPAVAAQAVETGRAEPRRSSRGEPRRPDVRAPDVRTPDMRGGDRARPRDRGRRDEDLGPSVLGFGDDVPAFMLLRSRAGRVSVPEPVESE